jgi:hypothetical protein
MRRLTGQGSEAATHMAGPTAAAAAAEARADNFTASVVCQETAAAAGGGSTPGPGSAVSEAAVSEAQRRVQLFLTALMSAESFDKHTLQVRRSLLYSLSF